MSKSDSFKGTIMPANQSC